MSSFDGGPSFWHREDVVTVIFHFRKLHTVSCP